ncbi:MAG TPA: glycosyltransferase, partial [Acidimicrobiia bacterium]|nr:glycosyltransferase [Acidimicrobiia bacterium]
MTNSSPGTSTGFRVIHLTTVDLSLRFLVRPQLLAVAAVGGEPIGVSAPGPWVAELESQGVRHVPLRASTRGMSPLRDLLAVGQLWRVLRRERPTVLHTHNPKPGLYGRVVGRLAGVPLVVNTMHGLYATDQDRWARRAVVYGLEAIAARFSDIELHQNPEDLELARAKRILPRGKGELLGNGVDLARFDPALVGVEGRHRIREELGIGDDQIVIGMVGRLVAEKGYPELFEAV